MIKYAVFQIFGIRSIILTYYENKEFELIYFTSAGGQHLPKENTKTGKNGALIEKNLHLNGNCFLQLGENEIGLHI